MMEASNMQEVLLWAARIVIPSISLLFLATFITVIEDIVRDMRRQRSSLGDIALGVMVAIMQLLGCVVFGGMALHAWGVIA